MLCEKLTTRLSTTRLASRQGWIAPDCNLSLLRPRDIRSLVLDTRPHGANNHWAATSCRQPWQPCSWGPEIIAGLQSPARPGTALALPAESFIINDSTDRQSNGEQLSSAMAVNPFICGLPTARVRPSLVASQGRQPIRQGYSGFHAGNNSRLHPFWLSIVP